MSEEASVEKTVDPDQMPDNVLTEIPAKLPTGKRALVDIFSGIGGLSLGFKRAGFTPVLAIESEPAQAATYALNNPDAKVLCGDCRKFKPATLAKALGDIAVITGGVPCEPFSLARVGATKEDREADPRINLISYAMDLVEAVKPKMFVFENVERAFSSSQWARAFKRAEGLGYKVHKWILLASEHGAPQARKRGLFVGAQTEIEPPEPGKPATPGQFLEGIKADWLHAPEEYALPDDMVADVKRTPPGERLAAHNMEGKYLLQFKLSPTKPAIAVIASGPCRNMAHWDNKRFVTPREIARLQGIPDDYKYPEGVTPRQVAGMIGDCVPVPMATKIARHLSSTTKADATSADLATYGAQSDGQGTPAVTEDEDLRALSKIGDDDLLELDKILHDIWAGDVSDEVGTTDKAVVDEHVAVLREMAKRETSHRPPSDDLDETTIDADSLAFNDVDCCANDTTDKAADPSPGEHPLPDNVLTEIPAKIAHASMAVVDIFSGIGGLSLGFKRAGFNSVLAMESEPIQAGIYALNNPNAKVLLGDCRKFAPKDLAKVLGDVAVITGGVPCEPFSSVRGLDPKKATDPRKHLISYAIDMVEAIKPKAFVFENVPRAIASPQWARAFKRAEGLGYKVSIWKMIASEHGCPQTRKRAFFIGVGPGVNAPAQPEPHPGEPVTARDALRNTPNDRLHNTEDVGLSPRMLHSASLTQPGSALCGHGGLKNFSVSRLDPDAPSKTILASSGHVHWNGKRYLTARETAIIQGFPNDYKFPEHVRPNRIAGVLGDCVPIQLATVVAKAIRKALESKKEGAVDKATWDAAYVNDLPDSAFLLVEAGGKKDDQDKTVPRSLRHFPVRDADGKVDIPHLRNAIARVPQAEIPGLDADAMTELQAEARALLADANEEANKTDPGTPLIKVALREPLSDIAKAAVHATLAAMIGVPVAVVYQEPELLRVRIVKADMAGEERYIEGVVLEPTDLEGGWEPDAQREVYSAEDVRVAMLGWAEKGMRLGLQHTAAVPEGAAKVLETWQTRAPYKAGDQDIKVGTWMMSLRVIDGRLWGAIRSGAMTGFSIGGMARRVGV